MPPDETESQEDHQTLLKMAAHLRALATDIEDVEEVVNDLAAAEHNDDKPIFVLRLQKIDHVCQSLRDLAKLSAALAQTGAARDDALSELHLATTRALVAERCATPETEAGVVDLF